VTSLLRATATTLCAVTLTALLVPAEVDAQPRQAVPRAAVPARPIAHPGGYHRAPAVYRPYYSNPYWYGGFYPGFYPYSFYFSVGFPCCGYPAYGYPYYPYYGYPFIYDNSASLRLQVSPREAEVFVDGYYAGTVDDFDGTFQRLHVVPGDHDLELFLPGHRSYQQKVYLQPGKTFNVRHAMEPLAPGDAEPARPTAKPQPAGAPPPRSSERHPGAPPRDRDRGGAGNQEPGRTSQSQFGSLALRVQPGDAIITIDGDAWENPGQNERLIVQLGPGVHNVQISKDGYRTYMTDVTIRPGETTALNVAMTPN
jgi:hypothetical protein